MIFEELNKININGHTEEKNGLTYLSWAWAWAELCKIYPDATYKIIEFDGKPYLYDENLGYLVRTEMTIDGLTHEMWLPVMDTNNYAMKSESYTVKTKYKEVTVKSASMMDINKTIMRCLVKNIAMFGLGLYIYAGEDLPEEEKEEQKVNESKISATDVKALRTAIKDAGLDETKLFKKDIKELTFAEFKQAMDYCHKAKK